MGLTQFKASENIPLTFPPAAVYSFLKTARTLNIFFGIDCTTINSDLKMDVRPCRTASGTHQGNHLAFLHGLPDMNQDLGIVAITCGIAIAVVDFHQIAIAGAFTGVGDNTSGD